MRFHIVVFFTLTGPWVRFSSFQTQHMSAHDHQRTLRIVYTNGRKCALHSANRGGDYYVTHGHSKRAEHNTSITRRHAAAPRFQSVDHDQC